MVDYSLWGGVKANNAELFITIGGNRYYVGNLQTFEARMEFVDFAYDVLGSYIQQHKPMKANITGNISTVMDSSMWDPVVERFITSGTMAYFTIECRNYRTHTYDAAFNTTLSNDQWVEDDENPRILVLTGVVFNTLPLTTMSADSNSGWVTWTSDFFAHNVVYDNGTNAWMPREGILARGSVSEVPYPQQNPGN
jgi:hypothetical protein